MTQNPNQDLAPVGQQVVYLRPAQRPQRRVFRWWLILVPLLLLFIMWLGQGLTPALSFDELADACGTTSRGKFAQLVALGVLISTGLVVLRVLRRPRQR